MMMRTLSLHFEDAKDRRPDQGVTNGGGRLRWSPAFEVGEFVWR
jgi:hypothetical protein